MAKVNSEYAIETISLTKVFPDWWGRAKVIAVDDLNLCVKHNEVYGLLGPNGSGKTTTLKMLLGLLYPTKGKALLLGGDSSNTKISERIGYLPEDSYLYRYLSAKETLDFYGRLFGLPSQVRKHRIESLLEMVGLTGMANRPVGTFSKGMARRIGLAQALINDPDLLILDEPTSGMDPISTRQMKDLFIRLASRGKTILLCSHLLADVEDVCDRIGILYGGKMQIEGQVKSLLQKSSENQIVTGQLSENALEKIKQIVREEQQDCEISSPMERLEDFFVQTVASAQEREVPTSGAVNTGGIGGFLAAEDGKGEDILDKLVSVSVKKEETDQQKVQTEKVERKPVKQEDSSVLEKLTGGNVEQVQSDKPKQPEILEKPVKTVEQVNDDLLKKLTGNDEKKDLTERTVSDKPGDIDDA
ncbi:MAG: ABC transporter ATP-binding protein [Sedimentisphaerales bacterium]|nr:ABC transporter ATP-binding protein [Sedimentisphaerales bacterium]